MNTINDVSIRQQQINTVGEDTSTTEVTERSKKALEYGFPGNDHLTAIINKSEPRALPAAEGDMSVASAQAGATIFSESASIDFGRIAEILLKLDFESEKASKDMVISDILDVADTMNESADKIMASAGLALAAGVVSGVASIAAGGISIAGGMKTMSIVNEAQAGNSGSVTEDTNSTVQEATSGSTTTPSGMPKTGAGSTSETSSVGEMNTAENIQELTQQATQQTNPTTQADANLQSMKSQTDAFVLSQRANSVSLTTQGLSQSVSGTGQIISSALKFGSDQQQAESKRTDALGERRRSSLERERQYADTISKSANSLKQMLLDVEQGRYQTSAQTMRV